MSAQPNKSVKRKRAEQERPEKLPPEVLQGIGERWKIEAERLSISQADIARAAGITRAAVNHWFRGKNPPSLHQIHRVAMAHPRISLDFLFRGQRPYADPVLALAERIASMPKEEMDALEKLFRGHAPDQRVETTYGRPAK